MIQEIYRILSWTHLFSSQQSKISACFDFLFTFRLVLSYGCSCSGQCVGHAWCGTSTNLPCINMSYADLDIGMLVGSGQ